jgi:hypothetical protein
MNASVMMILEMGDMITVEELNIKGVLSWSDCTG